MTAPNRQALAAHEELHGLPRPDYAGGSIVNLMSSIALACGCHDLLYPPLRDLDLSERARNIVLLVIDGMGYNLLRSVRPPGVLRAQLRGRITSVFPSTTATAITTFLTGLAPQQHGLTGWHVYLQEIGEVMAVLPFRPRDPAARLADPVDAAARIFDQPALFGRLSVESHVVAPAHLLSSQYNVRHCRAAKPVAYAALADLIQRIVGIVRGGDRRKYIYAYYPELDRLAHEHGPSHSRVHAHLTGIGEALNSLVTELQGTQTTLIVTADHGFIDTDPGLRIDPKNHPELSSDLARPLCGESRVAYCYVAADRQRRFTSYVTSQLRAQTVLLTSDSLYRQGYFGFGNAHPQLTERIGDFILIMKDRYTMKDWLPNEKRYVHRGVHGGMSEDELYVPCIVTQT